MKILTFGGQKLFTGNGYNLPFLLKKKTNKNLKPIENENFKIEVNHRLHS